jgi:hypothetical protein
MFDLGKAEDFLEDLIDLHDDRLQDARGFGMRVGAIPKGLMPYAEAQRIVTGFNKDTEKLSSFLDHLSSAVRMAPPEMKASAQALLDKASATMDKFKTDLKKAQQALEQHEDLLVGENFQTAFEALRMAVLDLDLADDADIDFTTQLELDKDPAYAFGTIHVSKGTAKVLRLVVAYRATDDKYWGNIHVAGKSYKEVVTKTGHTFLPRFIRELVDQTKALADKHNLNVFKSRKRVELKIVDTADLAKQLEPKLKETILKASGMTGLHWQSPITFDPKGEKATATVDWNDYGWPGEQPRTPGQGAYYLNGNFWVFENKRKVLAKPFKVATPDGTIWDVVPEVPAWIYSTRLNWQRITFKTEQERDAKIPLEWRPSADSAPIADLRKRAQELNVQNIPSFGARKSELIRAMRTVSRPPIGFVADEAVVKLQITKSARNKTAEDERFATMWRKAGGVDVITYSPGKRVEDAWRDAVDEATREYGHQDGYSGAINSIHGYRIKTNEPMYRQRAYAQAEREVASMAKDEKAWAIPVTEEKVLKKEVVTVNVEARDEKDAIRKGTLLIKATGRIPPRAAILVTIQKVQPATGSGRLKTFVVTGERRASLLGEIVGWVFYGVARS